MAETNTKHSPLPIRTCTLEEIDSNLAHYGNLLRYSRHSNRKDIIRLVDGWLDRRLEVTNGA